MRKKNKPFNATEADIISASILYNIPSVLIREIYSIKRTWIKDYFFWITNKKDYCTYDEYQLMFITASFIYKNQTLIGRKLPMNDKRSIEINNFLTKIGANIQYHPNYGMIITDIEPY